PPQLSSLTESVSNMLEGGKGMGKGEFDLPAGIAVDGNGNVLVSDTNNGRIEKFSPTGSFLSIMGTKGTAQGLLGAPNGIAVDRNGNLYVADAGNHHVQKLAPNGTLIAEWRGKPYGFEDLAIDSKAGRLYASSTNINAVFIFDLNGNRIGSLTPKPPDQLEGPSALALTDRKLYVVNMFGDHVSVIDL